MLALMILSAVTLTPACVVVDRPEKFERRVVTVSAEVVSAHPHGVFAIQKGCKRDLLLDPRALHDTMLWNAALQRVVPLVPRRRTRLDLTGTVQRIRGPGSATPPTYVSGCLGSPTCTRFPAGNGR
jgi:hypothetical protein